MRRDILSQQNTKPTPSVAGQIALSIVDNQRLIRDRYWPTLPARRW